ncbi:hypothetical protein NIES4073_70790 [Kalymmatonema gypsitolerans NIES-4073]|nr:hypothetical protein NIES4073_70790 [Scytonema sp. NIES-4073]
MRTLPCGEPAPPASTSVVPNIFKPNFCKKSSNQKPNPLPPPLLREKSPLRISEFVFKGVESLWGGQESPP